MGTSKECDIEASETDDTEMPEIALYLCKTFMFAFQSTTFLSFVFSPRLQDMH